MKRCYICKPKHKKDKDKAKCLEYLLNGMIENMIKDLTKSLFPNGRDAFVKVWNKKHPYAKIEEVI